MFSKLGRFTYRYKKYIIIAWVFLAIFLSLFAFKLPMILSGSGFETNGSYQKVKTMLNEDFDIPKTSIIVLFESTTYKANDKEYQSYVENTLLALEKVENVTHVDSPYTDPENKIDDGFSYALIHIDKEVGELEKEIVQVKKVITKHEKISTGLTGEAILEQAMNKASQDDLKRAEMIGIPIAILVLIFAFGSLIASSLPLIVGIISVLSTMGVLYFVGQSMNLSIFLLNVVPMIGLALGIDFALLLVNRFKEELKEKTIEKAIISSVETAGRSIAFSGFCVFLGLSGMLVFDVSIFKTVAIGGMAVVIISVLCALTFLPALLSVIGLNINKYKVLRFKEKKHSNWHTFSSFVIKRPVLMSLFAFLILIIGILPVKNIALSIPGDDAVPKKYEARIVLDTFKEHFQKEEENPVFLVLETEKALLTKESLEKLDLYLKDLKKHSNVKSVDSIFSTGSSDSLLDTYSNKSSKELVAPLFDSYISNNKMLAVVHLNSAFDSSEAKEFLRELKVQEDGFYVHVGGYAKFNQEIFDEIFDKVFYGLFIVLVSTYIVLFIAFKSVIIPLKAIFMNLLSLTCSFGILVWLFQGGHFGIAQSDIALMIPVLIFGVVFGLSMDYEVFLISKMHEVYLETKDNDKAILLGLTSTSKIITSAALIMIVVTGAFSFTDIAAVKQIGLGIALSIFIDATIVRMILVPSLMKLMGNLNWWSPKFLRKKDA